MYNHIWIFCLKETTSSDVEAVVFHDEEYESADDTYEEIEFEEEKDDKDRYELFYLHIISSFRLSLIFLR